jgi:hypothetical protein
MGMELWRNLKNSSKIMELFSGFFYLILREAKNSQEEDGAI